MMLTTATGELLMLANNLPLRQSDSYVLRLLIDDYSFRRLGLR